MLIDGFDRRVDYLRVSVTERCNFRCQYCMPDKPFEWVPKENLLSFEQLFSFVKIAMDEGVTKVRITGGEPLLRHDLDKFIQMIHDHNPRVDLALTSNGYLLAPVARKLKEAGLKRINLSLDTLDSATAQKIVQKDVLAHVLEGIDAALEAGMEIKINMVPMKGINDHEILEILQYCKAKEIVVRFIEYMENSFANAAITGLSSDEILKVIGTEYDYEDIGLQKASPSHYYRLGDGYKFGIIEPHKDDFCSSCNRIRLTAEGYLIPCLYFDEAKSIKDAIQAGDFDRARTILKEVVRDKPEKNRWSDPENDEISSRAFYETGG